MITKLPTKLNLVPYKNACKSGVSAYQLGHRFIILEFEGESKDGKQVYLYSYEVPGKLHVEEMKKRAIAGKGLASYKNGNLSRDEYYAYWDKKKDAFVELNKIYA